MNPTLSIHQDRFELRNTCQHGGDIETCKLIPSYKWNPRRLCWTFPATCSAARELLFYFPGLQADEDARLTIEKCLRTTREIRALKDAGWENAEPIVPYPMNLRPFNPDAKHAIMRHQILGANIGLMLPFSAILGEVGSSKTVMGIAPLGVRYLNGEISRAVIVTPKSVTQIWPREFKKFAGFPVDCRILRGASTAQKIKRLREFPERSGTTERYPLQVAVVNYESAWRMIDELIDWDPQYLGCDEAHRCKTPSSKQSKGMHKLGKHCEFVQLFTGTPISNHPLDIHSQFKIGDPSIFGDYFGPFQRHYAIMGGFEGREIKGYKNLPDLIRKIDAVSFRCTKADVLDLPPVTDETFTCQLEPAAMAIYRSMSRTKIAEIGGEFVTAENVLTKLLRLQQISGGFVTDDEGTTTRVSTAKLDLLSDLLVDLFEAGEKVIIFARFVAELDAIQALLDSRKIKHVAIRGGVADALREQAEDTFQDDPECLAFVGQIKAASEGITLVASATTIFYSWDYDLIPYTQAKGRNDRPGQTRPVRHIHLVVEDTMDVGSLDALQRKQNVSDAVIDGGFKDLIEGRPIVTVESFTKNGNRAVGDLSLASSMELDVTIQ